LYAAILGPIWFGMRNIWNWALTFLIIETFSVVQIIRGLFGNITADAIQKIEQVQSTIAFRNKQLEAAITNNPDKVDVYKRNIKSLEDAMQGYIDEVSRIEASAIWITIFGIVLLISIKIVQGILANSTLEKRYSEWLSDKSISPGMQTKNYILSTVFASVIMFFSVVHYSFPGLIVIMDEFPTHPDIRLTSIAWVETIFNYAVLKGDALFTAITIGIRSVLDFLELLFVKTPWIVIITAIVTLTGLSAGPRAAIYSAGFLCYMGFLGFWVKAMTTLALLGTGCNFKYCNWNTTWDFLCKTTKILFNDKTNNGFYANNASVCIYDPSYCIFWNRKSCSSNYHYDIWWNTSCQINSAWFKRSSRDNKRSCDSLWCN
jgi:glycine betaine/proline transport system permease protein